MAGDETRAEQPTTRSRASADAEQIRTAGDGTGTGSATDRQADAYHTAYTRFADQLGANTALTPEQRQQQLGEYRQAMTQYVGETNLSRLEMNWASRNMGRFPSERIGGGQTEDGQEIAAVRTGRIDGDALRQFQSTNTRFGEQQFENMVARGLVQRYNNSEFSMLRHNISTSDLTDRISALAPQGDRQVRSMQDARVLASPAGEVDGRPATLFDRLQRDGYVDFSRRDSALGRLAGSIRDGNPPAWMTEDHKRMIGQLEQYRQDPLGAPREIRDMVDRLRAGNAGGIKRETLEAATGQTFGALTEMNRPVTPVRAETPGAPGRVETPGAPGRVETPGAPGRVEAPAAPPETDAARRAREAAEAERAAIGRNARTMASEAGQINGAPATLFDRVSRDGQLYMPRIQEALRPNGVDGWQPNAEQRQLLEKLAGGTLNMPNDVRALFNREGHGMNRDSIAAAAGQSWDQLRRPAAPEPRPGTDTGPRPGTDTGPRPGTEREPDPNSPEGRTRAAAREAFGAMSTLRPQELAALRNPQNQVTYDAVKAASENPALTRSQREAMSKLAQNWPGGEAGRGQALDEAAFARAAGFPNEAAARQFGEQARARQAQEGQQFAAGMTPTAERGALGPQGSLSRTDLDRRLAEMRRTPGVNLNENPEYKALNQLEQRWNDIARGDGSRVTRADIDGYLAGRGQNPAERREAAAQADLRAEMQRQPEQFRVRSGVPIQQQINEFMAQRNQRLGLPAGDQKQNLEAFRDFAKANGWSAVTDDQWNRYINGDPSRHTRPGDPSVLSSGLNGQIHGGEGRVPPVTDQQFQAAARARVEREQAAFTQAEQRRAEAERQAATRARPEAGPRTGAGAAEGPPRADTTRPGDRRERPATADAPRVPEAPNLNLTDQQRERLRALTGAAGPVANERWNLFAARMSERPEVRAILDDRQKELAKDYPAAFRRFQGEAAAYAEREAQRRRQPVQPGR